MDLEKNKEPDLYSIKEELDNKGIFLTYNGPFNQNLVIELVDLIKIKLGSIASTRVINKIVTIFIEQTQNVIRYSECNISGLGCGTGSGICAIGISNKKYFVTCGNFIHKDLKNNLKDKLDALVLLNKGELTALYKKQKKKILEPDSKGAGLGLIDMASKSCKPLNYQFTDVDNEHCFFRITVYI